MADLTVRIAGQADIAPLDALFRLSYPILLAPDYSAAELAGTLPRMARAQPALVTSGTYYIAELDGQLAGAGGWSIAAPGTGKVAPGTAHIRHVVVDHRLTRMGIARAVLERVFTDASAKGVTRLACTATRTAVPFYKALGFRVLGDTIVPIDRKAPFPAVLMERSL